MGLIKNGETNVIIPALRELQKGKTLVYHRGHLDSDRGLREIGLIADEAWKLYEEGRITLTQKRLSKPKRNGHGEIDWHGGYSPEGFEYRATGLV
jgi:hypothetical protein